jgi:N-methylhydantoinase A
VPELRRYEFAFMGRYEYQSFEIEVPFSMTGRTLTDADLPKLVEAFHAMHERIYSIRTDGDVVEFTAWKLRAIGKRQEQDRWREMDIGKVEACKRKTTRKVWSPDHGEAREVPVWDMATFGAGSRVQGPCLVEAETFTAWLKPGNMGVIDRHGNINVTIE